MQDRRKLEARNAQNEEMMLITSHAKQGTASRPDMLPHWPHYKPFGEALQHLMKQWI
jgi:hypothetical protein